MAGPAWRLLTMGVNVKIIPKMRNRALRAELMHSPMGGEDAQGI
jgi:hypothetical protein